MVKLTLQLQSAYVMTRGQHLPRSVNPESCPFNLLLEVPCRRASETLFFLDGSSEVDARDQNKACTEQRGISAASSEKWPPPVLITSYCYGYLHAEAWALSRAF